MLLKALIKILSKWLSIAILLLMSMNSLANTAMAEKALSLSGVDNLINQSEFVLRALLRQQSSDDEINQQAFTKMSGVVEDVFDKNQLRQSLLKALSADDNRKRLQILIEAYEKPLAKRMSALEKSIIAEDMTKAIKLYKEKRADNSPQLATVRRIDLLSGYSGLFSEIRYQILKTLNAAYVSINSPLVSLDEAKIDERLEIDRGRLRRQTADQVLSIMLYSYQNASSDDLNNYLKNFEQDVFLWFSALCRQTIEGHFIQQRQEIYKKIK